MQKKFNIEVDCANCAAKIENAVKNLPGVVNASVSFMAQKMVLEAEDVRAFERGVQDLDEERNRVLRAGLEELGVEFLPADDEAGVGYGVRQKFNPRTVKRIENWENEGGPALEDDI